MFQLHLGDTQSAAFPFDVVRNIMMGALEYVEDQNDIATMIFSTNFCSQHVQLKVADVVMYTKPCMHAPGTAGYMAFMKKNPTEKYSVTLTNSYSTRFKPGQKISIKTSKQSSNNSSTFASVLGQVDRSNLRFESTSLQRSQMLYRQPDTKSTLVTLKVKFHLRASLGCNQQCGDSIVLSLIHLNSLHS